MKKAYFVRYYRDFANTYYLKWAFMTDKNAIAQLENDGYKRITRRRAEELVSQEKYRQKYDQSMSGHADDVITPWDFDWQYDDWLEPDQVGLLRGYKYCREGNVIVPLA